MKYSVIRRSEGKSRSRTIPAIWPRARYVRFCAKLELKLIPWKKP